MSKQAVCMHEAFLIPPGETPFRNVDAFSGHGAIARGFKGRGHRVARLDIELNELDDTQPNLLVECQNPG